ncbi:MAG: hypothetical protein ACRDH6_09770 [Actinomycetota bacterium]
MTTVEFLDEEPNGIASMIGGLLEANLQAHPERRSLLAPPTTIGIVATDAGAATTIHLAPGRVTVANGLVGRPTVRVSTDSSTLTELSSVPLRFGLPDAFTPEGRETVQKLLRRTLQVKGMLMHVGTVSRLNRLLSVL